MPASMLVKSEFIKLEAYKEKSHEGRRLKSMLVIFEAGVRADGLRSLDACLVVKLLLYIRILQIHVVTES
jgi:hypothetical protein